MYSWGFPTICIFLMTLKSLDCFKPSTYLHAQLYIHIKCYVACVNKEWALPLYQYQYYHCAPQVTTVTVQSHNQPKKIAWGMYTDATQNDLIIEHDFRNAMSLTCATCMQWVSHSYSLFAFLWCCMCSYVCLLSVRGSSRMQRNENCLLHYTVINIGKEYSQILWLAFLK